jgi:hypothetical protein
LTIDRATKNIAAYLFLTKTYDHICRKREYNDAANEARAIILEARSALADTMPPMEFCAAFEMKCLLVEGDWDTPEARAA